MKLTVDSSKLTNGSTPDNMTVQLSRPLKLEGKREDWEVGLYTLSTWYTWHNISTFYGNNILKISFDGGSNWLTITIDNGLYDIPSLNDKIQQYIINGGGEVNKIKLIADYSIGRCLLFIDDSSGYQVDLQSSVSKLHYTLGFNSAIYTTNGYTSGQNTPNMTNNITSFVVSTSLIDSEESYNNSSTSNDCFSFVPSAQNNESPGRNIFRMPTNIIYFTLSNNIISSFNVRITDQSGNRILFNDTHSVIEFHLRKKK